jgi:hypothetical protein
MNKLGITRQRVLATSGMLVAISLLLSACGPFLSSETEIKVDPLERKPASQGRLFGTAVRHILGPVDELVKTVPLEQPELLLVPIVDNTPGEDETITVDSDPALVFAKLKENSSVQQIITDQRGEFSAWLGLGEYLLCVSYIPPWVPPYHQHQCISLSISKSKPTQISIIFSPMVGLHIRSIH